MSESARNEELTMVVFGQFDCHMLSIGRRTFPDIHCHIENPSLDYTYKLGLSVRWFLKMEPTHYAIAGLTLVILDEMDLGNLFCKFSF